MQVTEIFERASGRLPMVPKVVQELVSGFARTDINIQEITRTIGQDQVLTAKVLRLANSASFGSRNIASLDDAVALLGFDNVRMLVIASGIASATEGIQGFDMKSFWQRSFAMANTCHILAKLTGLSHQVAYTCGLLFNIGDLVLYVAAPELAIQINKQITDERERPNIEHQALGLELTEVGAELARRWSFPEEIQQAILKQNKLLDAQACSYALLIGLASLLFITFKQGTTPAEAIAQLPSATLDYLKLSRDKLQQAQDQLYEACTQQSDMF